MNRKQEQQIFKVRHLENLQKLFNINEGEAVKLFKSLRLIECKLNRLYTTWCERELTEAEDKEIDRLQNRVKKLTNNIEGLKFNADPRGYSIKIDDEVIRAKYRPMGINLYSDWGGYGILAPDFN